MNRFASSSLAMRLRHRRGPLGAGVVALGAIGVVALTNPTLAPAQMDTPQAPEAPAPPAGEVESPLDQREQMSTAERLRTLEAAVAQLDARVKYLEKHQGIGAAPAEAPADPAISPEEAREMREAQEQQQRETADEFRQLQQQQRQNREDRQEIPTR